MLVEPNFSRKATLAEGTKMEEEQQGFVDFVLDDGDCLRCSVLPNETMAEFAARLKQTAGVTIGISRAVVGGQLYDENTDVLTYFSAKIPVPQLVTEDVMEEAKPGVSTAEEAKVDAVAVFDETDPLAMDEVLSDCFCSVNYCGSSNVECPELTMFSLPRQRERRNRWLMALKRNDLIGCDDSMVDAANLVVCSNHFLADQFLDKSRTKVVDTAVPSLFMFDDNDNPEQEAASSPKFEDLQVIQQEDTDTPEATTGNAKQLHPGALCRLCGERLVGCPIFIFDQDGIQKGIIDMIDACLPITVSKSDPLPKQICEVCHQRLLLNSSFVKKCMEAEEKLTNLARNFIADRGLCYNAKLRKKDTHTHLCPFCCMGNMEVEATEANLQLTHNLVDPNDDPTQELYSDEENDASKSSDRQQDSKATETFVDNPMDLLYLPEDRVFSWSCKICEEIFPTAVSCEEHCKTHSLPDYFPCMVCGLVFQSEELFHNHFFNHKVNQPVKNDAKKTGRAAIRCGTCHIEVKTRMAFMMHPCPKPVVVTSTTTDPELHSCISCSRIFTSKARAHKHLEEHFGEVQYINCGHCGIQTTTKKILKHHIQVMHNPESFECEQCGLKFLGGDYLRKHCKIHEAGTVQYQCAQCSMLFTTLIDISLHLQSHFNQDKKERRKCTKCQKVFGTRADLETHMDTAHNSLERMPSLIQYQCTICDERIKTSAEVLVHRTLHWQVQDQSKPFLCEYCGEPHVSPNALARHRRYLHPDEHPYICTLCDKLTRTLYEARVHRRTHTGGHDAPPAQPKVYQCSSCPSLFSDKTQFIMHKRSHMQKYTIQTCEICNAKCKGVVQLARHRAAKHTGEKPFSCGVCGKQFLHTSAMYHHARIHTGEAPHICDICGRKYRTKSDRDSHRRKHTGEKPYTCEFCGKKFRTGQVYYQHRMIHSDERRFKCDMCDKSFKRSHTLVCHRRIHTGEKPNICDVCGKGFRQRTDMRKHRSNMHPHADKMA